MAKKVSVKTPVPTEPEMWLVEVAMAFKTAQMFMSADLEPPEGFQKAEPWQLAPLFCLSARGIKPGEAAYEQATETAFESLLENYSLEEIEALAPVLSFGFCYMGAHLGLGLIGEAEADQVLDLAEENLDRLNMMADKVGELLKDENPFAPLLQGLLAPQAGKAKAGAAGKRPAKKGNAAKGGKVYVIEISLLGIEPRIWRRVAVPGDSTLGQLSVVIQAVFGWDGGHLHEFRIGKRSYGAPSEDLGEEMEDESGARLCDLIARKGQKLHYIYDFGDNWEHELAVKEITAPEPGVQYPACLAGERAAPPEDSGGAWGYEKKLEVLKDPGNADYEDIVEWMGEGFDPEAFDLKAVNGKLRRYAR